MKLGETYLEVGVAGGLKMKSRIGIFSIIKMLWDSFMYVTFTTKLLL